MIAIIGLFLVSQVSMADALIGFTLNESGNLGPGTHSFYGHGATWDDTDYAPGGYSSQSLSCLPPGDSFGDRFTALTGSFTDGGAAMTFVNWLKVDSAYWISTKHTYAYEGSSNNYYGGDPGEFMLWIEDTTRKVHFNFVNSSSSDKSIASTSGIAMDVWVHVAVVFDNGTLDLYIDGVLAASPVSTGSSTIPTNSSREIRLGAAANRSEQWFGNIDEWCIFDEALTQSQVQEVIDVGIIGFLSPLPPQPDPECGDPGTIYYAGDFNKDCYNDVGDVAELALEWLN